MHLGTGILKAQRHQANHQASYMPAYVVVQISVHDPVTYEHYMKIAPPSIAAYGGRYIVRGRSERGARGFLAAASTGGTGIPEREAGAFLVGVAGIRPCQGHSAAVCRH